MSWRVFFQRSAVAILIALSCGFTVTRLGYASSIDDRYLAEVASAKAHPEYADYAMLRSLYEQSSYYSGGYNSGVASLLASALLKAREQKVNEDRLHVLQLIDTSDWRRIRDSDF